MLGISVLVISIPFGINVMVIGYSFVEQWKDLIPSLVISLLMGLLVMLVELLGFNSYITLLIQIPVGALTYFGLAYILKFECFTYLLSMINNRTRKVQPIN